MKKLSNFSAQTQDVFENDIEQYTCFSKLLVDTGRNAIEVYSKEDANKKIREKFNAVLGLDEKSTRKEMRKAIRKNQIEIFEIIEETVENLLVSGWAENEFFNEYCEIKNISIGDENEFYCPDESVLSVSDVSGNHHAIIRQRLGSGETFKVKESWYGIKIYEEFEIFMAGRCDWAAFINKIYEAIDQKMNILLYDAFMGAGDKLPSNDQFNKTGNLDEATKEVFFNLLTDVGMATGSDVIVMGTKTALRKLNAFADVEWATDEMKKDRQDLGHLGTLEGGYKLVEIPQRFAKGDTANTLVDNTKLFIMPVADNRFIKVVNGGEAIVREITDGGRNMDMTYEYEVLYKMGVAVIIGLLFGVWTIEA